MPRTSPRPQVRGRRVLPAQDLGAKGQRTKARILAEAKRLMLERGFDGTSIGDITEAGGIRRASFYTYFTSKEDVLMALGQDAEESGIRAARKLADLGPEATVDEVADWVEQYFAFWDEHGAFVYAAFQAAYAHPELRDWSEKAEMMGAKVLGRALVKLRGGHTPQGVDPTVQGLALESMLERFWYHWRVAGAPVRQKAVVHSIAQFIWASTRVTSD
jgi:AcrR family transcriptional regulator